MNALALQAGRIPFVNALTEDEQATLKQLRLRQRETHNAYYILTSYRWRVQLYLGGAWILGSFKEPADVFRFADMCIYFFWEYKQRAVVLDDSAFNFSVNRAKADLAGEPELVKILEAQKKILVDDFFIPATGAELIQRRAEQRAKPRAKVADAVRALEARVTALEAKLK